MIPPERDSEKKIGRATGVNVDEEVVRFKGGFERVH